MIVCLNSGILRVKKLSRDLRDMSRRSHAKLYFHDSSYSFKITNKLSLSQSRINKALIIISNTSILNPGPTNTVSVFYQNIQGLIPFSNLADNWPNLDVTKVAELQGSFNLNKPDIIILNETWLKNSILDTEIFSAEVYNVFRLDRSKVTHPPDPLNPKKFRQYGGGVLIVIRNQLVIQSKYIQLRCKAEFLAIELKLNDNSKIIIATCYRVDTLRNSNLSEISKSIKTLVRKRSVKEFVLIGDFNLPKINWSNLPSTVSLEQDFLLVFAENSLLQRINVPTHYRGNTLDLLLTQSNRFVDNVTVHKDSILCKSDHYSITFDINIKCKRSKIPKRKSYNFKKADWERLNLGLREIDWKSVLESSHPDTAWNNFVEILRNGIDLCVPKIMLKTEFQPIGYNSECHRNLCKEKERYKATGSLQDGLKFAAARREFKKVN